MTDDSWTGLSDFLLSMQYWRAVQQLLAPTLGDRGHELLGYEAPYLDGNRVRIPNGPAFARDSDGYREYSILQDPHHFSIRSSGVSRADEFSDSIDSWFGSFALASKSFLYVRVCTRTLRKINTQDDNRLTEALDSQGLPPEWQLQEVEGPTGHPKTMYFNAAVADDYYVTFSGDVRTSQIVTKPFRQINELYAAELGLDRLGIPIPDTTT